MAEEERLGGYRLVRPLGRGGMAEVFLAERDGASPGDPPVVVKRILPALAADERFVNLFLREGRMAMRMEHPNLVRVHEIGRAGDEHFLVMEFLDGLSLRDLAQRMWRRGDTLPLGGVMRACADAALGLAHAHALTDGDGAPTPLIHRDISPDNIVLCRDGTTKVVDFGLARTMQEEDNLTRSTELRGKLSYMAPEYLQGLPLDGRADVFSLGVTLYWLLTRRSPFRGDTDALTIFNVLSTPTPDPLEHNPHIPAEVVRLLLQALEKDRERRTPSALAFHDALEALTEHVGAREDAAALAADALTKSDDDRTEGARPIPCAPAPPRGGTIVDAEIADLTTVVTPDAPNGDRTLRLRLVDVAGRDTTLEGAPLPFGSSMADTAPMPRVSPPTRLPEPPVDAPAFDRPRARVPVVPLAAAAGLVVIVAVIAAFTARDARTAPSVVEVRTDVEVAVAAATMAPPEPASAEDEETPPRGEDDVDAQPPVAEPQVDKSEKKPRAAQRTKRRHGKEAPSPAQELVRVNGPRGLRWLLDGRALSVSRGAVRVPSDTRHLDVVDPRTGGRSRVPVVDGVADYSRLPSGSAFFLVRPWAKVRIGGLDLGATPFDPVTLPVGRYQAELTLEDRTVTRAFEIEAGQQTAIRVNMSTRSR